MATSADQNVRQAKRGLGTVAFLKARFDAGMDQLDMLEPFVEDAIQAIARDDIAIDDIVNQVSLSAGLRIPAETTKTLLQRIAKTGLVQRRGGRYFRSGDPPKSHRLSQKLDELSQRHELLATALRRFALERGERIGSNEDALAVLVEFLDINHICFVLGQDLMASSTPRDLRLNKLVAAFATSIIKTGGEEYRILDNIVKGLVVQNALLSRHIPRRWDFEGLTVFLDTGVLLRALGYAGHTERNAAVESLEMIRKAGAKLRVFEKTTDEVTSILQVYEEHLRTPGGVKTLRPTPLTANWLRTKAKPADIRQEIALLPRKLTVLGVRIEEFPSHVAEYTEDERKLADKLRDRYRSDVSDDSRVWHDVEAVAAVLTLRADRRPRKLSNAGFLFVSESPQTIANVQEWYQEANASGFQPIVDLRWITNAAWMVGPGVAPEAPIHQLVAACTAMLMPHEKVWSNFIGRLEELVQAGDVTDDETIAVLASEFTWERIGQLDPNTDLEADSVREIVERAEQQWSSEHTEQLNSVVRERDQANFVAAEQTLRAERVESSVEKTVRCWARRLCWVFSGAVVLAVAAGAYLSLPTIWSGGFRLDPNWGILWWVLVGLFLLWSVLGVLFTSWSVQQLVATASSWCERCILKALLPKDGSTEITRKI